MVNTILKEADLFCPNSVRINFTIYHKAYYSWIRIQSILVEPDIVSELNRINKSYASTSLYYRNNAFNSWHIRSKKSFEKIESLLKNKGINKNVLEYIINQDIRPFKIALPLGTVPEEIKEINIIGHSLNSDVEIISDLLKSSLNLIKVNLFYYDGESKEEINRKKIFISRRTNAKINLVKY